MEVEMKDSGIPWVGSIPKDWLIFNIGSCTSEVSSVNGTSSETNALQFKMGEIIRKSDGNSKYNPETLEAYNIVEEGVVMINGLNLSFDLISQRVGIVKERGVITSTYIAIKPNENLYPFYFNYLMKAYDNCKAFHAMGRGLRQTLSYGELRKHPIIVPPIHTQQQIATFLDDKCADIDQLIALQQKMIDELKTYKQSVITEAVTKGLDKNVPMKDSGIEWIGEVPEGWKKVKLKNLCRKMNSGTTLTTEEISDEGIYPVFGGNGVRGFYNNFNQFEECLLIGRQGALCGNVKHTYEPIWATEHAVITLPNELANIDYLYFLMIAMNLNQYSISAAQPGLAVGFIQNVSTICPPIKEQKIIASFIETKSSQIDTLISIKQQKIDELKDYKKSMIYEYITGKKQVPN